MVYFLCKAYDSDRQNCYFAQSLPVRGAWIEMRYTPTMMLCSKPSLPVRGAWIEIRRNLRGDYRQAGRSPCGERGLKYRVNSWTSLSVGSLPVRGAWIEMCRIPTISKSVVVAPRAGSVD